MNFDDIRPYNDKEASEALKRVSCNPYLDRISAFLFPGKDPDILRNTLNTINGVDDFQLRVMYPAIRSIISKTTSGLSYDGLEYFKGGKCYTLLSNHRDIVLDPAFIQYVFRGNGLPSSEIAVGDNLISSKFVEDMMRSNRMIKVIRSSNPRQVYMTSLVLSEYMRARLSDRDNPMSIWISHRNGRTKDGDDRTEQGLLKMLSISGSKDFVENFSQLALMPVAISYEIEPCAMAKSYETYIRTVYGKYVKRPGEDLNSIINGIVRTKGRVHISFCKPISTDELQSCLKYENNDRFKRLAEIVDERITESYRLWPFNVAAAEIAEGRQPSDPYMTSKFENYIKTELESLPQGCSEQGALAVRNNILAIYANPALKKISSSSLSF